MKDFCHEFLFKARLKLNMLQNPNPSFSDASSNAPSIFWKMGMDVLVEFDFKFFLIQGVGLQARIKLNKKVKTKESSDRM